MFPKSTKIVYISPGKVIGVDVVDVKANKVGSTFEFGWTNETLDLALVEISKKFNTKNFRILISDEFCYIVRVPVPAATAQEGIRAYILQSLRDKIPEVPDEAEWDYKIVAKTPDGSLDAMVYVLVKGFARAFFAGVTKAGLVVEVTEPESVAKTRNANPIIGLAIKGDVSGRDEEVLNIKPVIVELPTQTTGQLPTPSSVISTSQEKPSQSDSELSQVKTPQTQNQSPLVQPPVAPIQPLKQPSFTPLSPHIANVSPHTDVEPPKSRNLFFTLMLIFIPLILIGMVVGGILYAKRNTPTETTPEVVTTPTPTPEGESIDETVEELETEPLVLSALKVQVQNGSGTTGEANRVVALLKEKGFVDVVTGNAANFDFTSTEVSVKSTAKAAYKNVEEALSGTYSVVEKDELDSSSKFDIVVVVGDKK